MKQGMAQSAYAANREHAVTYVEGILRQATDWQEGQHALANHPTIGAWLRASFDADDALSECQSIIREAEARIGEALPY